MGRLHEQFPEEEGLKRPTRGLEVPHDDELHEQFPEEEGLKRIAFTDAVTASASS